MSEHIYAPWTLDQVERLNAFQRASGMHPFTCGNDSRHVLTAGALGWTCAQCDYTQDWAHAFMASRTESEWRGDDDVHP